MPSPLNGPPTRSWPGPDPGRSIRVWVTLMLRLGIGLSLLGSGLNGYFGLRNAAAMGGGGSGMGSGMAILEPFLSGLPYLSIAVGLALILGFLTTAAAIAAGFLGLLPPAFAVVQAAINGASGVPALGGNSGLDQFLWAMSGTGLPGLLTHAAMIWLSPLENNPFSVDALIFGRDEIEPIAPGPKNGPLPGPMPDPIPEVVSEAVEEPPVRTGD